MFARVCYRLRLWWLEMTIGLLSEQLDRVRRDLNTTLVERSDLYKRGIERGLQ